MHSASVSSSSPSDSLRLPLHHGSEPHRGTHRYSLPARRRIAGTLAASRAGREHSQLRVLFGVRVNPITLAPVQTRRHRRDHLPLTVLCLSCLLHAQQPAQSRASTHRTHRCQRLPHCADCLCTGRSAHSQRAYSKTPSVRVDRSSHDTYSFLVRLQTRQLASSPTPRS